MRKSPLDPGPDPWRPSPGRNIAGVLRRLLLVLFAAMSVAAPAALAEPTQVEVRVLARGAKFIGGYRDSMRIVLTDADTGEVLARGMTRGTTGDTQRILGSKQGGVDRLATDDSAVFRATLDLARPRRVTVSATGPLSQPQAATTVTSTQWILPGRHLTAGDGWRLEVPGLIVGLASPAAYQWIAAGTTVPLRAAVTMMCGCPFSPDGPWRVDGLEVEAFLSVDGGRQERLALTFDPASGLFGTDLRATAPGLYEVEIRAWMPSTNNAGVGRVAVFVR